MQHACYYGVTEVVLWRCYGVALTSPAGAQLPLIPLPGGGAAGEAGAVELFVAEGGHGLNGRGAAGGDVAGEEGGNR